MKMTLIAGSNNSGSVSTRLLRYLESLLVSDGITVSFVDIRELQLPLYSPESGQNPGALRLQNEIVNADALIVATPEYHGSISGALKNALDYLTPGHVEGKPVLSVSSAGGPLGISSLTHLQTIVRNLHGVNCAEWISVGYGSNDFAPDGVPLDAGVRERAAAVLGQLIKMTRLLSAGTVVVTG
ncbi:NAD(P)H-dependent FMN reductase [Paenibacillus rhizosphaerae]|uniref:NAD(P)H-dependent FMN reductase n=1 Tax=Paenibacillus rhizosphaerae TaxID=297318 RepID=A0A839TZE9_9BACL|nr:NADPH-dependent FMN reductase [Paenibacillus rhizosphaerae]MBB3130599.1 NAD(P)H-dependent FMN reductase [Paenibacillus rhizosphaerae]